jgi:hypothetical protein
LYKQRSVLRRARANIKKRHESFEGLVPLGYRTDGGVG